MKDSITLSKIGKGSTLPPKLLNITISNDF